MSTRVEQHSSKTTAEPTKKNCEPDGKREQGRDVAKLAPQFAVRSRHDAENQKSCAQNLPDECITGLVDANIRDSRHTTTDGDKEHGCEEGMWVTRLLTLSPCANKWTDLIP